MFQLVGGFVIRSYGNLKSCLAKLIGEIRDPNVISREGIEVNDSGYQTQDVVEINSVVAKHKKKESIINVWV